jgi:hypothetical protein
MMVRVPGYRFKGSGSIPGATRFSETGSGVHSTSNAVDTGCFFPGGKADRSPTTNAEARKT